MSGVSSVSSIVAPTDPNLYYAQVYGKMEADGTDETMQFVNDQNQDANNKQNADDQAYESGTDPS